MGPVTLADLPTPAVLIERPRLDANIRRAMLHGSVVASYCCEGFGLTRTTRVTRADLQQRVKHLEAMTKL